jgi:hypothetical protein
MKKYRVEQLVLCEVRVWNVVEAPTHEQALQIVAGFEAPTSVDGKDYEINSDVSILSTKVTEF